MLWWVAIVATHVEACGSGVEGGLHFEMEDGVVSRRIVL